LDFDAMPGGHTPPYVIPPALAMAEITGVNITANLEPGEIHGEQGASKLWIDWWEGNKE